MRFHPEFRRFLAGADGTAGGEEAVRQAARLARITGAELEIVHVAHPLRSAVPGDAGERLRQADARLDAAGRVAEAEHLDPMLRLLVGEPAHVLANEARRTWTDVVCVGVDAGFLHRPHLQGGVAAHLVHLGVRPTLVCRPGPSRRRGWPRRILVAADGSPSSLEAVRLAAAIAAAAQGSLRILHAVPSGRHLGWDEEGRPIGLGPVESARRVARSVGVDAAMEAAVGPPGPAVAAAAARWEADLVAVGDRGLPALGRLALGSVSGWLLHHLDRSLLVARAAA
ncbi:MAG TPA: universal stress protein [Actinomycetota bacterium]|nr:universal stress protein [Actinomycetota bacterium]